jgi:hypothetical protein
MKTIFILHILLFASLLAHGQDGNPNTMSVMVDGKEYITEPRRIKIGHYGYITGNAINPDKSLRFWLGSFDGLDMKESGTYLILGEDDNNKDDEITKEYMTGKYKGIAWVKWVEETKSPRMEYHVGESVFNGESLEAVFGEDGYLELTFNITLEGSYWKEKGTATAFGGIGRIVNKMEDKAVTSATGYDQDIDPEGNGYKKQKVMDVIKLTEGKVRLRMEK